MVPPHSSCSFCGWVSSRWCWGLIHRRLVLGKGELLTIYIMMVVATAFSGGERNGFCMMLLGSAAGVSYLATPENNWAERVHPYVAKWMVPQDELGIRWFFEGIPEGESIPWGMWLSPLLWWLLFMVALWMASICAMVILRRQWVEHEHLIYPITKVPLAMVQPPPGGSLVAPFFKSGLMWVGLSLSFGRESLNALHHYFPIVPVVPTHFGSLTLLPRFANVGFSLNLMILGFAYFLKADVMFGMWVFYALRRLEEGVLHMTGLGIGEALSNYGGGGGVRGLLAHQSIGAMLALVLFGLWMARGHLREVFRKAFRGDASVDDSDEIMSYRTAVWGVILGVIGMSVWLWRAGLPLWAGLLFLFGALVTFVSLTRIIAEAGLPMVFPRNIPLDFVVSGIGVRYIGPAGMAALGPTVIWTESLASTMMAHTATGLKLTGEIASRKRLAAAGAGNCHFGLRCQHLLDVAVGSLSRGRHQRSAFRQLPPRLHLGVRGEPGRGERGTERAGLAHSADRSRGDDGSAAHAAPIPVVAAASSGIRGQHGPGDGHRLVSGLSGLVDQDGPLEVRRPQSLSVAHPRVLRVDSGSVRGRGILADRRLLYRDAG